MKIGDTVTVKEPVRAWYSNYGMNSERIIRPGEVLTVTHIDVPRVVGRGKGYDVAKTSDGWQISTIDTQLVPV